MSKKSDRNSDVANVSSVWSNLGKSELEIFSRRNGGLLMKAVIVGIILALLPLVSSASDRNTTVRDRYGNIVETRDRYGDETSVRDRYGNITRTEHYDGHGQKTIRDRAGNIIGTEDRD